MESAADYTFTFWADKSSGSRRRAQRTQFDSIVSELAPCSPVHSGRTGSLELTLTSEWLRNAEEHFREALDINWPGDLRPAFRVGAAETEDQNNAIVARVKQIDR